MSYMENYLAWKETQVCIGCGRKCCAMEQPGEEKWMTEYLCTPCFNRGVRGLPKTMFDGESGTVFRTSARAAGAVDTTRPHITKKDSWVVVAHLVDVKEDWFKSALEHVRHLNKLWMFVDNSQPQDMEWTDAMQSDPTSWSWP